MAVVEGRLYAGGGQASSGSVLSSVEVYDPKTNVWQEVAPMKNRRQVMAAAVVEGRVYVGGGTDTSGTTLSSVEVYDPKTNVWQEVAPMSTARSGLAMAVMEGKTLCSGHWCLWCPLWRCGRSRRTGSD